MPIPVLLLVIWVVVEGSAVLRRRSEATRHIAVTLALWTTRPWAVWAVFNLINRWNADRGFNNPQTFPFYANPWQPDEPIVDTVTWLVTAPTVWRWLSIAVACFVALLYVATRVSRRDEFSRTRVVTTLGVVYLFGVVLHLSIACVPYGAIAVPGTNPGYASLTANWPTDTILPALREIQDTDTFLRTFDDTTPRATSIHALSHPPGAPLTLYWIGQLVGADPTTNQYGDILRYQLGLTMAGMLNVFVVYLIAASLFASPKVGLTAAMLWTVMPGALAFSTYAQDVLYAVVFGAALALGWLTVTGHPPSLIRGVLLGVCFFAMTMLNFSWPVVTAAFALFAAIVAWQAQWTPAAWGRRVFVPLGVMGLLLAATIAYYRLDYLLAFTQSRQFVETFYVLDGWYQWVLATVGGQLDLILMLGSVVCSAFFVAVRRADLRSPQTVFLLTLLVVYLGVIIFGPNGIKMENSRTWHWVGLVPLAFAASVLVRSTRSTVYVVTALTTSFSTYCLMRLFLRFSG